MKISIIIPVYNVEDYIRATLNSILKQTLTDFEVIIVNDDSPDNSQVIIDEFCEKDSRFKSYKELSGGVSSARNYGLEHASGEYVLFVDGDDIIPPKALELLYRSAKEHNSDMVVGMMQEYGMYGGGVFARTRMLAEQEEIDPYDPDFLWTFSVCNKLLRLETINNLGLRFQKIKHAEDGIFMFSFLFGCNKISGCKAVVYKYRKRPFWKEKSATQAATRQHLEDLLTALEQIERIIKEHWKRSDAAQFNMYIQRYYERVVDVSLLREYYRQIWKSEEGVFELLGKKYNKYRKLLSNEIWEDIVERNQDLRLENGLMTKDQLCARPLVTVALSDKIPETEIARVIESLYNQKMPAFVIHVHKKHYSNIPEEFTGRRNLIIHNEEEDTAEFKNNILNKTDGKYIHFIDEGIYLNNTTYKNAIDIFEEDRDIGFVSFSLRRIVNESGKRKGCRPHKINALGRYLNKNVKSIYNSIDWMSGNKIFRVKALKKDINFTKNPIADIRECYKNLVNQSVASHYVFTSLTTKDVLHNTPNKFARFTWLPVYIFLKVITAKVPVYKQRKFISRIEKPIKKFTAFCKKITPVQNKVFFISIRSNRLVENNKAVYEVYKGKKSVFTHMAPHNWIQKLKIYWNLASSKIIVTDDYLSYLRTFELKPEQKVIQLWHACGAFKKFGLDYVSADITREKKTHRQYDAVVVSSESIREVYANAFGIDVSKVLALGTPRTDNLMNSEYVSREKERFYDSYPQFKNKKIILYTPTFRENGTERIEYDPQIEWNRFSEILGDDIVFIIKRHPIMKYDLLNEERYNNIIDLSNESTERLMMVCDILVTDYSSTVFEGALLEKPLILYCPDFGIYERDFYLKFPDDLYGVFVTTQEGLIHSIEKILGNPDVQVEGLGKFKEKYMGMCDGHSSERVAQFIHDEITGVM